MHVSYSIGASDIYNLIRLVFHVFVGGFSGGGKCSSVTDNLKSIETASENP